MRFVLTDRVLRETNEFQLQRFPRNISYTRVIIEDEIKITPTRIHIYMCMYVYIYILYYTLSERILKCPRRVSITKCDSQYVLIRLEH